MVFAELVTETCRGIFVAAVHMASVKIEPSSMVPFIPPLMRILLAKYAPDGRKILASTKVENPEPAGATSKADIKGKIVALAWQLKKQGYAETTIAQCIRQLKRLSENAKLSNPESVKELLANHDDWKPSYKRILVSAYTKFVEMQGLDWNPPNYRSAKTLPFIPHEKEIDALIAGCSRKVATVLQLLKETGMRIGEAWQLEWIDIGQDRRTIRCKAEKHSNPRIFKVTSTLISMLDSLPKDSQSVFRRVNLSSFRSNCTRQRKRIAIKLKNPRILKITFHSIRHWYGTTLYHKTEDILLVKQRLGHKKIDNTLLYVQLADLESEDDFICRTASTVEEAKELIEAGFEFVTDM